MRGSLSLIALAFLLCLQAAPVHADQEQLMDQALQAADKVQNYYLELNKVLWQERNDLDHMPAPLDVDASNIGPGPIAYVERAFQGTDLARKVFLRDTWLAEAQDLNSKLEKAEAALRARRAQLAGKTRDVATVDENGDSHFSFSDPALARIDAEIARLQERIEGLARSEQDVLERVAVGSSVIQTQKRKARAFTQHPFNGVWDTTWGRLNLKIDGQGVAQGTYSYKTKSGRTVKGTIQGRLEGDVLKVSRWTETLPDEFAAGTGTMTLKPGGKRFVGEYQTTEGKTGNGQWSGDKVK